MPFEIPMKDLPSYTEEIALDTLPFVLRFDWNSRESAWFLTFSDLEEVLLVAGIKLIIFGELISKIPDRGLPPGELWVLDPTENLNPPGRGDFTNGRLTLVYYTEAEIEEG